MNFEHMANLNSQPVSGSKDAVSGKAAFDGVNRDYFFQGMNNPCPFRSELPDGLSIGDAFGQQFFSPHVAVEAKRSNPPTPPWNYTEDTEMVIALTETLRECESVDQETG